MKNAYTLVLYMTLFASLKTTAQIVFSENFGTGCSTGTLATAYGWSNTNTGTNQATANIWYVSAEERGMGVGNCGAACGGTNDRTLHLSAAAAAGGDLGAAYFESSAFICGFLGLCSATDKRIESPTINCTGISNIPFTFEYLENGEGSNDNGTVWYSANGGTTWSLLDDPPKTSICGGGQGQWASRSLTLPGSADNNSTVKIAFRWVNNANGTGTDPSFAIDNIVVGSPISLGVQMISMNIVCNAQNQPIVVWTTQHEENASHYIIYKSFDGETWRVLDRVNATNQFDVISNYSYIDKENSEGIAYFYIDQIDFDGNNTSYSILTGSECVNESTEISVYPNPSEGTEINFQMADLSIEKIEIFSMEGKKLKEFYNSDEQIIFTITPNLQAGGYFAKVISQRQTKVVLIEVN